tara:strand:+ start:208 stop:762 length:555 start_codon:yes stop_codon:yes gene_type:complete
MKLSKELQEQVTNLSIVILKEGSGLKNPKKFTIDDIGERVFAKCTDLSGKFLVTDEQYELILSSVIDTIREANRLSNNAQGEGYNVWMKDLKWFLSPKNEKGFGSRCYKKDKELQVLMGWTDEQLSEVARCFDKITNKDGNHIYRGVDSNDTYRDSTSNLGKITDGLGDSKKDVKRGELGESSK